MVTERPFGPDHPDERVETAVEETVDMLRRVGTSHVGWEVWANLRKAYAGQTPKPSPKTP